MSGSSGRGIAPAKVVLWIARLLSVLWFLFIAAEVIGEGGGFRPRGVGEFVVWILFPIGFTAGYLIGWRWPLTGGSVSLACLVLSMVLQAALHGKLPPNLLLLAPFAVLGVPGILYIIAGWLLRRRKAPASGQ